MKVSPGFPMYRYKRKRVRNASFSLKVGKSSSFPNNNNISNSVRNLCMPFQYIKGLGPEDFTAGRGLLSQDPRSIKEKTDLESLSCLSNWKSGFRNFSAHDHFTSPLVKLSCDLSMSFNRKMRCKRDNQSGVLHSSYFGRTVDRHRYVRRSCTFVSIAPTLE